MLINLIQALLEIPTVAKLTMVIAVVAFGLAVGHVRRPTVQKLAMMRPVSLAAISPPSAGCSEGGLTFSKGLRPPIRTR